MTMRGGGDNHDGPEPVRRVCAVCARVLDYSPVLGTWRHTRQDPDDHPVVPVTDEQIEAAQRCDFCSTEPAVSFIVAQPLAMVGELHDQQDAAGEYLPLRQADASWACCVVCDRLIRRRRWDEVTKRAARALAASGEFGSTTLDPMVLQTLRDLHRTVADTMVGQPVRYGS